jgi:hypothetical protein
MTRVPAPSSSGETVRVARERVRKDSKEREDSGRLGGAGPPVEGGSGNGAVHAARGAAFRKERGGTPRGLGARVVPRWVGDTAEALVRLS